MARVDFKAPLRWLTSSPDLVSVCASSYCGNLSAQEQFVRIPDPKAERCAQMRLETSLLETTIHEKIQ